MIKPLFIALSLSLAIFTSPFVHANGETLSKVLTSEVSVTGAMTLEKFQQLTQNNQFKTVIVNRPDDEIGNQVTAQQLRDIAKQNNVTFRYQPVVSSKITAKDIQEFAQYYNELPKPILMVCRSGSRSSYLFNQAKAQGLLNE